MSLTPKKRENELQRFRDRLTEEVVKAINSGGSWLIQALMSLGKTYTAGTVLNKFNGQLTVYTKLWDTREQIKEYALEHTDLTESDIKILPTLNRHCESFETLDDAGKNPRHPHVYTKVTTARKQGATASAIHESEKYLPCTKDGDCEYNKEMSFKPEGYDLIIGSPQHAHVDVYNEDRVVLIDEDAADSYEEKVDAGQVNKSVNYYLQNTDGIDVNSKTEMMNLGVSGKMEVLKYIKEDADMFDPEFAINTSGGRADSAALVRALLNAETLPESGFERAEFTDSDGGQITTVRDTQHAEEMTIRRPPLFRDTNGIVAMDGTPHHEMWENRIGKTLKHRKILDEEETRYFVSEVLNYNVYQTSTNMNPYSSGEHVYTGQLYALMEAVSKEYGQKVPLVTTLRARDKLQKEKPNVYDEFIKDDRLYYNGLRSHSEYENYELEIVAGCQFTGDREIQRLGALDGHDFGERDGKGVNSTFGDVGDTYYENQSHASTAQAIFRVGRGEEVDGADIFVHTSNIPDWIPVEGSVNEEHKIRVRQSYEREVMMALQDREFAHTKTIEEMVDCSDDTVRRHLKNEVEDGYVKMEYDRGKARWIDVGLEDANWWGEVDLPIGQ